MKAFLLCSLILSVVSLSASASYSNSTLGSCSYSATCTAGGIEGVCVSISAGCCSGTKTSNLCPGSSDIKCCTKNSCSTPSGTGTCMQTSACSGKSYSGYCTGPSDLQCCVSGTPTPTTGKYGVDVSSTITSSAASCFKSAGISFVIPRGYKSTGAVDTNVCTSIKNAAAAGIATRDAYMFPCKFNSIRSNHTLNSIFNYLIAGPTCSKSASTQTGELVSYLKANCASQWSGRVWLDVEGSQYWTGSTSSNQAWYKVGFIIIALNTPSPH